MSNVEKTRQSTNDKDASKVVKKPRKTVRNQHQYKKGLGHVRRNPSLGRKQQISSQHSVILEKEKQKEEMRDHSRERRKTEDGTFASL
jgi:hypothetical protein